MKFTPNSIARWRTRLASPGSFGSPQIPWPVSRIAPYPSRFISRSPPMVNVFCRQLMLFGCSTDSDRRYFKSRCSDENGGVINSKNWERRTENWKLDLFPLQHLHHPIEVLERGILDHNLSFALSVTNAHPHSQDTLHLGLGRAHIGINPARPGWCLFFHQRNIGSVH